MHVLGLPPAFVLSQDQTLKLKFDSGWLGGYSKESLRNGHLHTRRMQPGLPRIIYALVMAETQRSPESVRSARRVRASWIRQDSAACVSLSSIHLSKSARAKRPQRPVRLAPPRSSWKRGRSPGRPRRASRSIQRLPAHCRAPAHGARSPLPNLNLDPCQRVGEQILPLAWRQRLRLPQNGPHCNARELRGTSATVQRRGAPEARHPTNGELQVNFIPGELQIG